MLSCCRWKSCLCYNKDLDLKFEYKKEHVLRCIKLGMSFIKATIIAECTEEEIESLKNNKEFILKMAQEEAVQEYELLEAHEFAMEAGKLKGSASAIQWKLERINPERWAHKEKEPAPIAGAITVNLVGKGVNDDEP